MSGTEPVVLPPFTAKAKCPKCGAASNIATKWYRSVYACYKNREWPDGCNAPADFGEHLERTCGRCGYGWAEAVLS